MDHLMRAIFGVTVSVGLIGCPPAQAAPPKFCKTFRVNPKATMPLKAVTLPPAGRCTPRTSNGHPIPDPDCSPGAINPTVTLKVLKTKRFTTKCLRNLATSPNEKAKTYGWYNIDRPTNNSGTKMICELDHIISLQLGGADTLDNLWPQCGPSRKVGLAKRHFKMKDDVENYLAAQIKAGKIDLGVAQRGIAEDWTQFLEAALARKHGNQSSDGQ